MGDEAQRRAVRSAPVVIGDVPLRGVRTVAIPEPFEDPAELIFLEQEEQHHRIGLLGNFVAVGIVALRTQDPVQPLDVAVLRAVGIPVELAEVLVTFELADDSIVVERDKHPPAHVPPGR